MANLCTADGALWTSSTLCRFTALVIIPGTVNYFYNVEGKRLCEALRNMGCHVDVCTIDSYAGQQYDWCFLLNVYEIDFAHRNRQSFLNGIRNLKRNCRRVVPTLLEAVETKWYNDSYALMLEADLDNMLDMGFEDQRDGLSGNARRVYDFVFNGLTESERRTVKSSPAGLDANRTIPWAFVGQATAERLSLVEQLVLDYDAAGFVYLVRHVPYTENGPHLTEKQLEQVLRQTRFKVWCSHHQFNYLESIRFRLALMSGCVPVKVLTHSQQIDNSAPFAGLILEEDTFIERLRSLDFQTSRQTFVNEFCALPSLEESLLNVLTRWGELSA
jgi:hypothetical protein